jgi:hypothetical protein
MSTAADVAAIMERCVADPIPHRNAIDAVPTDVELDAEPAGGARVAMPDRGQRALVRSSDRRAIRRGPSAQQEGEFRSRRSTAACGRPGKGGRVATVEIGMVDAPDRGTCGAGTSRGRAMHEQARTPENGIRIELRPQ